MTGTLLQEEPEAQPDAAEQRMLAVVSVRQPWAEEVMRGASGTIPQEIATQYRGTLLVHTGKKWADDGGVLIHRDGMRQRMFEVYPGFAVTVPECVARGFIVGMVTLVDCDADRELTPYDVAGAVAWRVIAPLRFRRPIPYRGRKGLFYVPESVVAGELYVAAER